MPIDHKEKVFEEFIENYLVNENHYLSRKNDNYDKELCFDKELVLKFIQDTQEKSWEKLCKEHGEQVENNFFDRLNQLITRNGVLDVLKRGITDNGISFELSYNKPQTLLNAEYNKQYKKNIFSVIRQLKYSKKSENSIDMVIFINGIPIFTIELKNQLTGQNHTHGINQYRINRDSREKLLSDKRCLTHFVIDSEVAYMTTKLEGLNTKFLPFNKGNNRGSGNPEIKDKYKTHYMWENIWNPDMILELIHRFIQIIKVKEKKKYDKMIFPRYHQLYSVKRLIEGTRNNGAGKNYLIQHSAGSGKSKTIAWTAHRLSELHNDKNEKIFDSVIVVTDRRVLDRQLRNDIKDFEETRGVYRAVENNSAELKNALEEGAKIITTTLQKFPVIVDTVSGLPGKTFAVIIDEAHSSQSGDNSRTMREVLTVNEGQNDEKQLEHAEKSDVENKEPTYEELIIERMKARKSKTNNISFFAFTATPKAKTLEIFGTKNTLTGEYETFSLYSMKQAIEEGFILDVLKNYTTYQTYFKLVKKIEDDPEYEKHKASAILLNYVNKTDHAIKQKIEIITEHFSKKIGAKIDGKAKAMIVTRSRLHAVKFKLLLDKHIREKELNYKTLVAFSGTVHYKGVDYTESSMNGISEKATAIEFDKKDNKFLICANKFQTGFDQPLLSVMYVDKKLSGVSVAQTLSRLNRIYPHKEEVYILDFVNDIEIIKKAFQPYYETTILSEATDPNVLHDIQGDIYNYKMFTEIEVDRFNELFFSKEKPDKLNAFLDSIVPRFNDYLEEEQNGIRDVIKDYLRKYPFISQIISFEDIRLEKLYIFLKLLDKKIPREKNHLPIEIINDVSLDSYRLFMKGQASISLGGEGGELKSMQTQKKHLIEDEFDPLSKIINEINDVFGTDFSEEHKVILKQIANNLENDKELIGAMKNNPEDASKLKFNEKFSEKLVNIVNTNFDFYKKLDNDQKLKDYINQRIFSYLYIKLLQGE